MSNKFDEIIKKMSADDEFNKENIIMLCEDTNEETALKMLARFHETLSDCLENINLALTKNDFEIVWKSYHKITGTAELLGFDTFGKQTKDLCKEIRDSKSMTGFGERIRVTNDKIEKIKKSISSHFSSYRDYLA